MRIGILGRGVVGDALSAAFAQRGHEVRQGGRDDFAAVAEQAELAVLAVKGDAAEQVAGSVADKLRGKVLIDATNPLAFQEGAPPSLFVGLDDSLGERVQRAAPGAHVVKCFNIVSAATMASPQFPGGSATMMIAGDDDGAKQAVHGILEAFGWQDVIDLGGIEESRLLEPLCLLWVHVGLRRGAWDHAFKLLTG